MKFSFKELDREGFETLQSIALADKFNEWMYQTIVRFCKGEILEIGSGIGNISEFLIKNKYNITLSDIRNNYCNYLQERFLNQGNCKNIINLDLVHPAFDSLYASWFTSFDTIFALNVIEHIADDELAIKNAKKLLKPGGNIIILVPAYKVLYNQFDKELEHYRRYTIKSLSNLIAKEFKIIHSQYFNFVGIAGWFVSGGILKKKTIPSGQMRLYNKLVPFFRLIDRIVFNKIGLSVIVIGKKNDVL